MEAARVIKQASFLTFMLCCNGAIQTSSPVSNSGVGRDTLNINSKGLVDKLNKRCPAWPSMDQAFSNQEKLSSAGVDAYMYMHLAVLLRKSDRSRLLSPGHQKIGNRNNNSKETSSPVLKLPIQCTSFWTLNLTESYRVNSSISSKQQGDLNLLDGAKTWFRFSGSAGSHLSSNCSECAAFGNNGYWSNSSMPIEVGETARILFYQGCVMALSNIYHGTATRCQEGDAGLVYLLEDQMRIDGIICGMKTG